MKKIKKQFIFKECLNVFTGTESTDTVCGVCTNGTYSDGTFTACQPHTM